METLIENMWMKSKESWEQTRMLSYMTAQINSTKEIDIKELMTFPWEKNNDVVIDNPDDRKKMMEELMEYENKLNKR